MNAIRKFIESETSEVTINVTLPDEFKSRKLEVIIFPVDEEIKAKEDKDLEEYHQSIRDHYKNIGADLSNYKFNRDELYER